VLFRRPERGLWMSPSVDRTPWEVWLCRRWSLSLLLELNYCYNRVEGFECFVAAECVRALIKLSQRDKLEF